MKIYGIAKKVKSNRKCQNIKVLSDSKLIKTTIAPLNSKLEYQDYSSRPTPN